MTEKDTAPASVDVSRPKIGYLLHQVDKNIFRKHNEALKDLGINLNCAIALNYVVEHEAEGSINQRAIEAFTGLTNPAITKIITTLVEMGLVVRQTDIVDRRNHSLVSTESGRALSYACQKSIATTDIACFASLTNSDKNHLVRILNSLCDEK